MPKMNVDAERCTRCGHCALDCPASIFVQATRDAVPGLEHPEFCIVCGHCVAVCPVDAIAHTDFPEGSVGPIDKALLPTADQLLELIRGRRSLRVFKDKPVERDKIEQILRAAYYAPTGHNCQSTEYIVVQDPHVLKQLSVLAVDYLATMARQLRNPVTRNLFRLIAKHEVEAGLAMLPELDMFLEAAARGDLILHDAPCFIAFHARAGALLGEINANLALQNATLMADALRLGTFYTGFILGASKRDKRIPRLLGIPPGNRLFGGMTVGYPRFRFDNWIDRRPAQVKWM
ncbi:MAG: hypothetical protein QG656_1337 [Candidatus Hydrogenedentes bacterium]|nr:hypothetical protein [Candidatus Hydrogenedentota bacterium]